LADDWVSGAKEPEPQARAWTGTAMPVGLDVRYRFSPESTFCMGLDLRFVQTWYTEWLVDQSRSLKANIEPPVATGRFEPRLVLAWHL
jgi:hypothetical protein